MTQQWKVEHLDLPIFSGLTVWLEKIGELVLEVDEVLEDFIFFKSWRKNIKI